MTRILRLPHVPLLLLFFSTVAAAADKIYEVDWTRDSVVTLGAGLVTAIPYLFAKDLITFRCPCDPNEVNGFDRGVIGRNGATARVASDGMNVGSVLAVV